MPTTSRSSTGTGNPVRTAGVASRRRPWTGRTTWPIRFTMSPVIAMTRELYAADLEEAELAEAFGRVLATGWIPQSHNGSRTDLAALKDMTSLLVGRFVQAVGVAT